MVALRRAGSSVEAARAVETGQGKALMDALRQEVATAQQETRALAARQATTAARLSAWLSVLMLAALLLSGLSLGLYAMARRRAEQRATALLDGVMEHAPIALGFLDRQMRLAHANKALTMLGEKVLADGQWPEAVRAQLAPRLEAVLKNGQAQSDIAVTVPPPPRAAGWSGSSRSACSRWAGWRRASASRPWMSPPGAGWRRGCAAARPCCG
ncbi:hypothetical protein [Teichococcus aestuarii]|uniref:hypothetical protein n=1 Tax=Teichococcus aestuarii TaxID=568898 RepID=UPI00362101F0